MSEIKNIPVDSEIHKKAAHAAIDEDVTIKKYTELALTDRIKKGKKK